MRILFLCVLLVNIVFFLWQYRQGAPDVYLPPSYESHRGSARYDQKILLLSEVESIAGSPAEKISNPELILEGKSSELNRVAEPGADSIISELVDREELPVMACYQLKTGKYTQDMFTQQYDDISFKLDLFEQQRDIESYLLLTLAANSYQEGLSKEQKLKQQGMNGLWLFRQGSYKWRISLGLFSQKEQAETAQGMFTEQTEEVLEIVPGYQTETVSYLQVSDLEKQEVSTFEQNFSLLIEQRMECDNDIFSSTHSLVTRPVTQSIKPDISTENKGTEKTLQ